MKAYPNCNYCYYCGGELHYDSDVGLYVCNTKDCRGSSLFLAKGIVKEEGF